MKHCVVIPCLNRPEMLALALEKLDISRQPKNLEVNIFVDCASEKRLQEVEFVRNTYFPEAFIFHAKPHIEVPSGMWNILNSLKQGYQTHADRIYIIEEDILIYSDFFEWHDEAQLSGNYLATCGRRMRHLPNYNQYTNPGSCFSKDMFGKFIFEHICDELFVDRKKYFNKYFGQMDEISDLDDGLIRRIAKFFELKVKYPDSSKCTHIGFQAYNHYMGWANEGTIQQRIEKLRKMLLVIDPNNKYTSDFEVPSDEESSCYR